MLCDQNTIIPKSLRQRGVQKRVSIPWKLACFGAADLVAFALGAAAFLGAIKNSECIEVIGVRIELSEEC